MSSPHFYGPNLGYVLELYDKFMASPEKVDAKTAEFFRHWSPQEALNGDAPVLLAESATIDMRKVVGAVDYAQAIRKFGHLAAQLDPLGSPPPNDPELSPESHGVTEADLAALPAGLIVDGALAARSTNALEAIQALREIYSGSIGFDNEHIQVPNERNWLKEAAESRRFAYEGGAELDKQVLERLTQVEALEQFLQRTFPTKYRFSIEGLDIMVVMIDEVVDYAKRSTTRLISFGMAHRGRLNTLAHIMGRGYENIFAEFLDTTTLVEQREAVGWTVDDVKYHKGALRVYDKDGTDDTLSLIMSPNPSHLELVNPVSVGIARAAATQTKQGGAPIFDPHATLQVLIHGDAAFPGQGIVAETFNMSRVHGYTVGGTLHIIANNQIGFTTLPSEGRSTLYASDLAKGFRVPIVHVNADDPAACIEVARMAAAYTAEFEKDFLIDLVGYRRYGHNELDEPSFTQPLLYKVVRSHETVRALWAKQLEQRQSIAPQASTTVLKKQMDALQAIYEKMMADQEGIKERDLVDPPRGAAKKVKTSLEESELRQINAALRDTLEGFNFFNKRLETTIRARRSTLDTPSARVIDWAGAEEFAFASLLAQGVPIRLSGQEAQRGTFNHRHAVLHDAETGAELVPLQRFAQAQASFEAYNSPLSEEAVLGFEYGYNIYSKNVLVLWEAQYGDFVNGAQNVIDEFIVSAREKWGDVPSLVLLLPHAHEGAGPDHSSARLERFLSLAAMTNMRIAYPTTAAQYFHLLRRQALLLESDPLPLIVMSPKSLLRNPIVAANMLDLMEGRWQAVIDDEWVKPADVTRLIFVSGKFYYDLVGAAYRQQYPDVALVRVEQLYPFPLEQLKAILERYPNVKQIVWAQEEPKNMGAFEFMSYRLKKLVGMNLPVNYVGRRRSSSPAEGSKTAWQINQTAITEYAFDWDFNKHEAVPKHS